MTGEVTAPEVTVNVAVLAPAAIATDPGTCAAALLLDNVTVAPPAGAFALSVAVPTALALPPTTAVGLTDNEESAG